MEDVSGVLGSYSIETLVVVMGRPDFDCSIIRATEGKPVVEREAEGVDAATMGGTRCTSTDHHPYIWLRRMYFKSLIN